MVALGEHDRFRGCTVEVVTCACTRSGQTPLHHNTCTLSCGWPCQPRPAPGRKTSARSSECQSCNTCWLERWRLRFHVMALLGVFLSHPHNVPVRGEGGDLHNDYPVPRLSGRPEDVRKTSGGRPADVRRTVSRPLVSSGRPLANPGGQSRKQKIEIAATVPSGHSWKKKPTYDPLKTALLTGPGRYEDFSRRNLARRWRDEEMLSRKYRGPTFLVKLSCALLPASDAAV